MEEKLQRIIDQLELLNTRFDELLMALYEEGMETEDRIDKGGMN